MIESLTFEFAAGSHRIARRAHVGVVASGNLEVLVDSAEDGQSSARVRTSAAGFGDTWHALLAMFFAQHDVAMRIEINDFGASPPVVLLRLEQGLERATE